MTHSSRHLLAGLLLQTFLFETCFGFLALPSFSREALSKSSRGLGNGKTLPFCSLHSSRSSFGRGGKRGQLTSRAFQASEVIAKPPDVDMTFRPRADRVIALGDVHGDLYALDSALMYVPYISFSIFAFCRLFYHHTRLKFL